MHVDAAGFGLFDSFDVTGDQETYLAPTEKILDSLYNWETWMQGTSSPPNKDMHLLFKV